MIRIHRRDGGSRFSIITAKYLVRRIVAPLINWRRKLQMKKYQKQVAS
jgi:hypothetical protein